MKMRNRTIHFAVLSLLAFYICSCTEKQEEIPYEEMHERMEKALYAKYSEIQTLDELLLAQKIFINERIVLNEEDIIWKVKDGTYYYEEEIYLIDLLGKHMDKQPEIVISRLISFFQYAGASDTEYLSEMLSARFVVEPEIFVKSVNKQRIMEHLAEGFRSDEFIEHVYYLISRPLFDGCNLLSEEECDEVVREKLKDIKADSDFFAFLKERYGL